MAGPVLLLGTKADLSSLDGLQELGVPIHVQEWTAAVPELLSERTEAVIAAIASADAPRSAAFFSRLASHRPRQVILALVRADDRETLAIAVAHADDFSFWPAPAGEIGLRIERLMRVANPAHVVEDKLADELALANLVGANECFLEAVRNLPLFARSGMPVLIIGETGTGKELCARALHDLSPRRGEPFIAVDCSAIPDHLFENEMFGHARGAYTDAHIEQKGLVALAHRGTLFLDEIDSLSAAMQGKMLRFLEEKTYKPLGGEKYIHAPATVLAASNCDLETAVREKRFRSDLYYRLNVLQIRLPPLRQRRDDILLLARHFLDAACARMHVVRTLSVQAARRLAAYDWPGNVRELCNLVRRAAVIAEDGVVLPSHIQIGVPASPDEPDAAPFRAARGRAVQAFERAYVQDMLLRYGGNISRAARAAGQERRAFGRLVKKYKLAAGRI